jgi:hypothetical protein
MSCFAIFRQDKNLADFERNFAIAASGPQGSALDIYRESQVVSGEAGARNSMS